MAQNDAPPRHVVALRQRLRNVAAGRNVQWLERTIANVAAAQMLPAGVVKGGTAMRLRAGTQNVRFSADLDAARPASMLASDYLEQLEQSLRFGWSGFTGVVVPKRPANPAEVPADYVMLPHDIKLRFNSQSFVTVELEVGHDEVGSTYRPSVRPVAPAIVELFDALGLDAPQPVPILASAYQIAQKLHACTTADRNGGNDRAHDLIDIQLLYELDPPDPAELAVVGARLFRSRGQGAWPPVVRAFPTWDAIYVTASAGVIVRPLDDAIAWVNERIAEARIS